MVYINLTLEKLEKGPYHLSIFSSLQPAAVNRSRLFAQHLTFFGWELIILTVHEDFYEEQLNWNLDALLTRGQRIEKVSAYNFRRPRIIGDIGLRGFFNYEEVHWKS